MPSIVMRWKMRARSRELCRNPDYDRSFTGGISVRAAPDSDRYYAAIHKLNLGLASRAIANNSFTPSKP